jgi:hypothetical protein
MMTVADIARAVRRGAAIYIAPTSKQPQLIGQRSALYAKRWRRSRGDGCSVVVAAA